MKTDFFDIWESLENAVDGNLPSVYVDDDSRYQNPVYEIDEQERIITVPCPVGMDYKVFSNESIDMIGQSCWFSQFDNIDNEMKFFYKVTDVKLLPKSNTVKVEIAWDKLEA